MKAFIILAVVAYVSSEPGVILNGLHGLGLGLAHTIPIPAPLNYAVPAIAPAVTYAAAPAIIAPAVTKTQYHAQDELGQASHGYAHAGQAAAEVRDINGNVRGAYSYINNEGKEIRVEYTAGHGGFQVASNALPIAPNANIVAPIAPVDTPEVAQAKKEHQEAVQAAIARNAEADQADANKPKDRRKRGLIAAAPIIAPAAVTYNTAAVAIAPQAVIASPAVREAVLTKVVNNPLHAVSYRVD